MRKVVSLWMAVALIVVFLSAGAFAGDGHYKDFGKSRYTSKAFYMKNPAMMSYRAILRAANMLPVAEAFAKSVKDGQILYNDAKSYYQKAKELYQQKKYRLSIRYAVASMCLSKAVTSIYKAQNPVQLPPPPKFKKFKKNKNYKKKYYDD